MLRKILRPLWAQGESIWWLVKHMCHGDKNGSLDALHWPSRIYIIPCSYTEFPVPFLLLECSSLVSARSFLPPSSLYLNHLPVRPPLFSLTKIPSPLPFRTFHILSLLYFFCLFSTYHHLISLFCFSVSPSRMWVPWGQRFCLFWSLLQPQGLR